MHFRNEKIDPNLLSAKENQLLDEWASSVPEFIRDGCANPNNYVNAPVKLLFVLKEVNGGHDWDLREFMNDGCRSQSWDVIAQWIEGIFNLGKDYTWNTMQCNNDKRRGDFIPQVSAMNVKKTPGGTVTDDKKLQAFVNDNNNKGFIKKQLQLYKADIIILCGTEEQYNNLFDKDDGPKWKMTSRGIKYYIDDNKSIIISFSHPGARTKKCLLYYGLIDAIKEIKENN